MDKFEYPKNEREWRATTGMDETRFAQLLEMFESGYVAEFGRRIEHRVVDSPRELTFPTCKSLMFFTLFCLKSGLTYDVLGFVFKLDVSNAKRNLVLGLRVLKRALGDAGLLPKREFASEEEFGAYFQKQGGSIIVDGTEQRMQRPKNQEEQKVFYSGKKNLTPPNP
ncbi:MAG: hypothetical protein ACK4Q5_21425 [Saprospiraceae bacterium]